MLRRLCAHGVKPSAVSQVMSRRMFSLTADQQDRALARASEIRANHHELHFPEKRGDIHGDTELTIDLVNRKRMIYRSKQRGWLEVDLLLGSWATKHVMHLSTDELQQYEDILNQETIDIFNWISNKDPIPEHLQTPIMKQLHAYCASAPLGKASPKGFEENKKHMSN